mgnify:CR=1 FL=1
MMNSMWIVVTNIDVNSNDELWFEQNDKIVTNFFCLDSTRAQKNYDLNSRIRELQQQQLNKKQESNHKQTTNMWSFKP